jgi:hypothetical protein
MTKKLLLLVVSVLAVGLPLANAQKDAGKPYEARDPQPCGSRKDPAKGAPSATQAAHYVTCDREAIDGSGHLGQIADLKVEVGKGHASTIYDQAPNIDPAQTVYAFRGSFKSYYCSIVAGGIADTGKNCQTSDVPAATGSCYKDSFGDWHCTLGGPMLNLKYNMPPMK